MPEAYFSGMSKFIELEPGVYVTGQIDVADLQEIDRLGIRSILDNRPDEEIDGRNSSDMIAYVAGKHRISFRYQPVWGFDLTSPEHKDVTRQWISEAPGPVLLYCRSGRRSTLLWAQTAVERLGIDAVLAAAERAGFNADEILMVLEDQLDQLAA